MIEIKRYRGPANKTRDVTEVLKALRIPSHSVSVFEQNQDTGYPGLAINYTFVDINLEGKLLKKVESVLKNLNFTEEK